MTFKGFKKAHNLKECKLKIIIEKDNLRLTIFAFNIISPTA